MDTLGRIYLFDLLSASTPNNNQSWEHVFWPLLRVRLLSEVINTYFYVSRSMPLDCCREFGLFSGGLCSEVSLYKYRCIYQTFCNLDMIYLKMCIDGRLGKTNGTSTSQNSSDSQ